MAFSDVSLAGQISGMRAKQTQATSTLDTVGSGTIYMDQLLIDNTLNPSTQIYVKLYDSGSSITVGEAVPDFCFPCAGGATAEYAISPGAKFTNGIKAACVTTAGVEGTTSPTNNVAWTMLYHS